MARTYEPSQWFQCEKCGKRFNAPDDPALWDRSSGCEHEGIFGVADARGRSTLNGISDAMQEIERFDCICRIIIVSGRAWMKVGQHDISDGKIRLWGAVVHFEGAVYGWEEEVDETWP
jgi:hypothetical protein